VRCFPSSPAVSAPSTRMGTSNSVPRFIRSRSLPWVRNCACERPSFPSSAAIPALRADRMHSLTASLITRRRMNVAFRQRVARTCTATNRSPPVALC
jgi:hypothetical protein